jgi:tRNA-specific 2-thiouridylase
MVSQAFDFCMSERADREEMKERETKQRVVVAMSGGVDSSMAAALLLEQGYEVIGIMLRLWAEAGPAANRCCTPDAVADARHVADTLGIPFYLRDYKQIFKTTVVDYFTETYTHGLTPNPCLICNRQIRYGHLLDEAVALGAGYLATGHYARVRQTQDGAYQLLKGVDAAKDQSYVLHRLGQAQLAHVLFPLGEYVKSEVREMARARGLPVFNRADSQDLCFLGNGDYREFLSRHAAGAARPGPILDTTGRTLGEHQGLPYYTIGQRKGLGIAGPQALYVLALEPSRNAIIVGTAEELGHRELTAAKVTYVNDDPPPSPLRITAKIRYKALEASATLTSLSDSYAHVRFDEPMRDITPGQSVGFYQGHLVLGGGIIQYTPSGAP